MDTFLSPVTMHRNNHNYSTLYHWKYIKYSTWSRYTVYINIEIHNKVFNRLQHAALTSLCSHHVYNWRTTSMQNRRLCVLSRHQTGVDPGGCLGGALQISESTPARTQNFVNTAVVSAEYSTISAPRRIIFMQLSQQKASHWMWWNCFNQFVV